MKLFTIKIRTILLLVVCFNSMNCIFGQNHNFKDFELELKLIKAKSKFFITTSGSDIKIPENTKRVQVRFRICLLYTSDAADE